MERLAQLRVFLAGVFFEVALPGEALVPVGDFPVTSKCLVFLGSATSSPSATSTAKRNPEVFTDLPRKRGRRQMLVTGSAFCMAVSIWLQGTNSGLKKPPPSFLVTLKWSALEGSWPRSYVRVLLPDKAGQLAFLRSLISDIGSLEFDCDFFMYVLICLCGCIHIRYSGSRNWKVRV